MHRARSPRRHRQHRLIIALYLIALALVALTWLANPPLPIA